MREKENNLGGHCRPLERRIEANCCIAPARSSDDCTVARLRPLPLARRSPSFLLLREEVGAVCERVSESRVNLYFSHPSSVPLFFLSVSLIIKRGKRERGTANVLFR